MKREHSLWRSCGGSVNDFELLDLKLGVPQRMKVDDNKAGSPLEFRLDVNIFALSKHGQTMVFL